MSNPNIYMYILCMYIYYVLKGTISLLKKQMFQFFKICKKRSISVFCRLVTSHVSHVVVGWLDWLESLQTVTETKDPGRSKYKDAELYVYVSMYV